MFPQGREHMRAAGLPEEGRSWMWHVDFVNFAAICQSEPFCLHCSFHRLTRGEPGARRPCPYMVIYVTQMFHPPI